MITCAVLIGIASYEAWRPRSFRPDFLFDGYVLADVRLAFDCGRLHDDVARRCEILHAFAFPPYRLTTIDRPEGTVGIACMGDSTVYGLHVEADQTWCSLLARDLSNTWDRPVAAFNFGIPGSTSYVAIDSIIEHVLTVHPDRVVLAYGGLNEAVLVPIEEREYTRFRDPLRNTLRASRIFRDIESTYLEHRAHASGIGRIEKVPLTEHLANLSALVGRIRAAGSSPVLLVSWAPIGDQPNGVWTRARSDEYAAAVAKFAREHGVQAVEVHDIVMPTPSDWYVSNQLHFNPAGHERVARRLAQAIAGSP